MGSFSGRFQRRFLISYYSPIEVTWMESVKPTSITRYTRETMHFRHGKGRRCNAISLRRVTIHRSLLTITAWPLLRMHDRSILTRLRRYFTGARETPLFPKTLADIQRYSSLCVCVCVCVCRRIVDWSQIGGYNDRTYEQLDHRSGNERKLAWCM